MIKPNSKNLLRIHFRLPTGMESNFEGWKATHLCISLYLFGNTYVEIRKIGFRELFDAQKINSTFYFPESFKMLRIVFLFLLLATHFLPNYYSYSNSNSPIYIFSSWILTGLPKRTEKMAGQGRKCLVMYWEKSLSERKNGWFGVRIFYAVRWTDNDILRTPLLFFSSSPFKKVWKWRSRSSRCP